MKIAKFISHNREISAGFLVMMVMCVLVVTIQPVRSAQFVLSSWSYPDEYGQGINAFDIFENSTGDWLYNVTGYSPSDSYTIEWEAGVGIKIRCYTSFNYTLTGAVDIADGQNYQRHNVTVTNFDGETIFNQENFTYYNSAPYESLYWYNYDVVLDFLPDYGQVYTVTITYEIYW